MRYATTYTISCTIPRMEPSTGDRDLRTDAWSPDAIRGLRDHLGDTQQAFAGRLGTRQQTVSEWERSSSRPRRMAQRLLHMVAEESGFYDAASGDSTPGQPRGGERR